MVQPRAAMYSCNRYRNTSSVTDMLNDLNWESLESRRTKIQVTMLYRILNNLVDIDASDHIKPASTRTRGQHKKKLRHLPAKTNTYKYSVFPWTILTGNSLPAIVAEVPDLVHFKQELAKISI